MKKRDFRLPIATMSEGEHEYTYHLDGQFFKDLERDEIIDSDVDATVTIVRRGDRYEATFDVVGAVTVACHRCLEPLQLQIDDEYRLQIRFGVDYDDSTDGLLILGDRDLTLDIAPILADTVQLNIPLRAVHPDGECDPDMTARFNVDEYDE